MSKNTNPYAQKAKRKKLLELTKKLDTKNNLKNSALETGKDLVVGAVIGGTAGAFVGKPSLLVGIGVSLAGHYFGQPLATSFGLGMMASGGYQIGQSVMNGTEGLEGMDAAKARFKAFTQNLKERLYLDKIIKPKAAASNNTGTAGLGEVQYFQYPQETVNGPDDFSGLDSIEQQLKEVAGTSGYEGIEGPDDDSPIL